MKIQIPTIGSVVKLTKPWTFTLIPESRNELFWEVHLGTRPVGSHKPGWQQKPPVKGWVNVYNVSPTLFTFPRGTLLRVSRIYIRNGNQEMDSITFVLNDKANDRHGSQEHGYRFWARLSDVNQMHGVWQKGTLP